MTASSDKRGEVIALANEVDQIGEALMTTNRIRGTQLVSLGARIALLAQDFTPSATLTNAASQVSPPGDASALVVTPPRPADAAPMSSVGPNVNTESLSMFRQWAAALMKEKNSLGETLMSYAYAWERDLQSATRSATLTTAARDGVIEECAKALDRCVTHINENAGRLRKWPDEENEARGRELGALFVREAADTLRSMKSDHPLMRLGRELGNSDGGGA